MRGVRDVSGEGQDCRPQGQSVAFLGCIHTSADSCSQTESTPAQRG